MISKTLNIVKSLSPLSTSGMQEFIACVLLRDLREVGERENCDKIETHKEGDI